MQRFWIDGRWQGKRLVGVVCSPPTCMLGAAGILLLSFGFGAVTGHEWLSYLLNFGVLLPIHHASKFCEPRLPSLLFTAVTCTEGVLYHATVTLVQLLFILELFFFSRGCPPLSHHRRSCAHSCLFYLRPAMAAQAGQPAVR